jgi:hypothetical protein
VNVNGGKTNNPFLYEDRGFWFDGWKHYLTIEQL